MSNNTPLDLWLTNDLSNNYEFHTKDAIDFLWKLKDNSVDFILTDPPYFINEEMNT